MRVDEVSLRIFDTRFYHRFSSPNVLIETKAMDSTFSRLAEMGESTRACDYNESHKIEHLLQQRYCFTEEVSLE